MERFGLIGKKLGHSLSPDIHARLGNFGYELIELAPDEVGPFLEARDFRGLNVTIPYKKTVLPYLDELTPRARAVGNVNTILKRADGTLLGDNTDYAGFEWLLHHAGIDVRGRRCLVLGSGGASQTVQAVLRGSGAASVTVISRSGPDNYDNLEKHADAQVIVNATPVGMHPNCNASPLKTLDIFPQLEAAADLIYNPARTDFLAMAQAKGVKTANGLGMLIVQAQAAHELFFGQKLPEGSAEGILEDMRRSFASIVLIGMPGCGKTTVGRRLAQRLRREFRDVDELIVKRDGRPIPQIFAESGEDYFRDLETSVIEELSLEHGLVIATGGGSVLRPRNRDLLRRNGYIIWLNRPIDQLPTKGRPVSQAKGVEAIFKEREPIYRSLAERTIVNTAAAQAVSEILGE
jgi:shikimate dehydrogenase